MAVLRRLSRLGLLSELPGVTRRVGLRRTAALARRLLAELRCGIRFLVHAWLP